MDQLQTFLSGYLGAAAQKVYIQPPASMQMVYPCVLIQRDTGDTAFADNNPYRHLRRYLLTGIDEDPSSDLYSLLASLPRSRHERSFTADNLYHDVFTIFFKEES